MRDEPIFKMQTEQYDVSYPEYYNMSKRFGAFSEDGGEYTVTDRHTPRQWFSFMCNDTFASVMSNDGHGFFAYRSFYLRMTKHYVETDYLLRRCNGERPIAIVDGDREYNLYDAEDLHFTVRPGECEYTGSVNGIEFDIVIFVPKTDPVECTKVTLKNVTGEHVKLRFTQDWAFMDRRRHNDERIPTDIVTEFVPDGVHLYSSQIRKMGTVHGFTRLAGAVGSERIYTEQLTRSKGSYTFHSVALETDVALTDGTASITLLSGVTDGDYRALWNKYADPAVTDVERDALRAWWNEVIAHDSCNLPDKTMQHMLNVWLKNQLYMTSKYNRFNVMGYRDILQDAWGVLFVSPERTREHILISAEHMFDDGRCPRQFDLYDDENLDRRDFSDSPVWMPIALCDYIKQTGDFAILDEEIGYLESDKRGTLLDHVLLSFDYLYHSRGTNGLVLMRGGDWLDGLEGINKWGEATSVWLTIATYYAQNMLIELLEEIGKRELAATLKEQCAEYKYFVNTVGWNGKWYSYATIDDEHIGHPDCLEAKIYLNAQTWAIFSGIADDDKIKKLMRGVELYLTTPYGPQLLAPPYAETGEHHGRLRTQRPGTFANGAIYLHGASFKVYADIARGEPEVAYDTFMRILPGHEDNPTCRHTGEPYCVGNVHFGQAHQCPGLNLYGWFSATPAWMIHGGFEQLLGVQPTYHGLRLVPLKLEDWDGYSVSKVYRGTRYNITFTKSDKNAITVNGRPIEGNVVFSADPVADVVVEYTM